MDVKDTTKYNKERHFTSPDNGLGQVENTENTSEKMESGSAVLQEGAGSGHESALEISVSPDAEVKSTQEPRTESAVTPLPTNLQAPALEAIVNGNVDVTIANAHEIMEQVNNAERN